MEENNQKNLEQKIDEIYTGHKGVPISTINKIVKGYSKFTL